MRRSPPKIEIVPVDILKNLLPCFNKFNKFEFIFFRNNFITVYNTNKEIDRTITVCNIPNGVIISLQLLNFTFVHLNFIYYIQYYLYIISKLSI